MNEIKTYLSRIGRKGGKSGRGKSKARTSEQARRAVMQRWKNQKAKKNNKTRDVCKKD